MERAKKLLCNGRNGKVGNLEVTRNAGWEKRAFSAEAGGESLKRRAALGSREKQVK
jgi:hypothetical protein